MDGHHICATGEGSIAGATEPDHGGPCKPPAGICGLTIEERIRIASSGRKKNGKNRNEKGKGTGDNDGSSSGNSWLKVPDDPEWFNPAPFAFKPEDLALMSERRDREQLEVWGGTAGLLTGLGVDSHCGLSSDGIPSSVFVHDHQDTFEHLPLSPLSLTTAVGHSEAAAYLHRGREFVGRPPRVRGGDGEGQREYDMAAYAASLGDWRRVYGSNIIPTQKNKSLLRLKWLPTDRF